MGAKLAAVALRTARARQRTDEAAQQERETNAVSSGSARTSGDGTGVATPASAPQRVSAEQETRKRPIFVVVRLPARTFVQTVKGG